jgi:hypothetical protein
MLHSLARYAIIMTVLTGTTSVSAATQTITATNINRVSAPIVRTLPDMTSKAWANARLGLYKSVMQYRSYGVDNKRDLLAYKKEVGTSAALFLSDLSTGKYQFTISDSERTTVESTVLSYQQDLVRVAKYYIERAKNNDMRETGDMHFTLRSQKADVTINVDTYRIVQSRDKRNMEVDMRISMQASGSQIGGQISGSIDGNITIIGSDLYMTLRNYTLSTTVMDSELAEIRQMLDTVKGKTYHQDIGDATLELMQNTQE